MLKQSWYPIECNMKEVGKQTVRYNWRMYVLEWYAEQAASNDMVGVLVRQKPTQEVANNYLVIRDIAFILDKKFKCETRISADGWKNPLIVIPRKVLTK